MFNYTEAQEGIARMFPKIAGVDYDVLPEMYKKRNLDVADQILSLLFTPEEIEEWKKGGYPAIVCKDQSLPENPYELIAGHKGYSIAQQDMIKNGFARIVEE